VNSNYTQDILNKLNEYSNHPFLNKYFDLPSISEDKIIFLKAILDQTQLSDEKKEKYILATMLVQTALDTHDLVSNDSDNHTPINKAKRQKQLSILVGDLYSGHFYETLSISNDLPVIQVLSRAIKEINEHKMTLYLNDIHSLYDLMEELQKVESLLIEDIANYFELTALADILPNWLLMKRLIREQKLYMQHNYSYIVNLLSKQNQEYHSVRMMENMVSRISHTLEILIKELPDDYSELKQLLLDDLIEISYSKEILLEEG
jgi:heptaprenyl diphosphate synthase